MSTFLEGPAPGLSRIFPQSGPTGDMGAPIPISNPSSAASSLVFPSSSASQLAYDIKMTLDSAPTRTLDKACKIQFGVQTSNSVFNFPINASDIDQSTAVYELLSAPPFIPSRTHAHSRSRSWFSDALDEGAWKVESRLLPALKAIVLATQNAKQEDKPYLSDALTFLIAALQEARHMRITAKFGFDAARLLQEEKEDPQLNREQLERIAPLMQKKREAVSHSTNAASRQSAQKEGGRTQVFTREWEKIGVGDVITEGIRPIWKGKSSRERLKKENGRCRGFIGGKKEEQACAKWIQEGLRTEVLTKLTADQVGCVNNIFFIQKKNGIYRQILDCRPLNVELEDVHFKMDDHRTVEKLLQKKDWATSLDLSQAYFLKPEHREFTPYLAFQFRGDFFGSRGMPYGYNDAPRVFNKIMRKEMMQERKRWSVRSVTYFDNTLLLHQDRNNQRAATKEILELLGQLGLLGNMEKSKL